MAQHIGDQFIDGQGLVMVSNMLRNRLWGRLPGTPRMARQPVCGKAAPSELGCQGLGERGFADMR